MITKKPCANSYLFGLKLLMNKTILTIILCCTQVIKNANTKHKFCLNLILNLRFQIKMNKFLQRPDTIFFSCEKINLRKTGYARNTKHMDVEHVITKKKKLMNTLGEHNYDISARKSDPRNVIKVLKDLSERFIPMVAVASDVFAVTKSLVNESALPTKDRLIRTTERTIKHLDVKKMPNPRCAKIRDPWESFSAVNRKPDILREIILLDWQRNFWNYS